MPEHLMAVPILDRGGAADRMRNHLRRRAIIRPGLIEGDLYFLPFRRAAGRGPEGETEFHLLATEVGDSRLHRANLPPADLKPFDPELLPGEARLMRETHADASLPARAAALGWHVETLEELIHYPFWMMRIEDCGRTEGAWIDGVEGKIIHHLLKVPPPIPSSKRCAVVMTAPALLMGAGVLALGAGSAGVAAVVAVASSSAPLIGGWLSGRARREREG